MDAVFEQLNDVEASICGYAGGEENDADYHRVATGKTGHAESVQVTFDESAITKETMLDIFFLIHDPTTKDRQGNDVGPQYRSAMFYENEEQKAEFQAAINRAQQHWDSPIVTELAPLDTFYPAEPEHQDYFTNNPTNPYCSVVISPKVTKARRVYSKYFKED